MLKFRLLFPVLLIFSCTLISPAFAMKVYEEKKEIDNESELVQNFSALAIESEDFEKFRSSLSECLENIFVKFPELPAISKTVQGKKLTANQMVQLRIHINAINQQLKSENSDSKIKLAILNQINEMFSLLDIDKEIFIRYMQENNQEFIAEMDSCKKKADRNEKLHDSTIVSLRTTIENRTTALILLFFIFFFENFILFADYTHECRACFNTTH